MSNPDDRLLTPLDPEIHPEYGKKCPICGEWWNNAESAQRICLNCEDDNYECSCGVAVPYDEATERMRDYNHCEDCDSTEFE